MTPPPVRFTRASPEEKLAHHGRMNAVWLAQEAIAWSHLNVAASCLYSALWTARRAGAPPGTQESTQRLFDGLLALLKANGGQTLTPDELERNPP